MLDAAIKRIEVTDLANSVYYAKLVLEARGIEYDIDCRPSDALALAVRMDAPLFIAQKSRRRGRHDRLRGRLGRGRGLAGFEG